MIYLSGLWMIPFAYCRNALLVLSRLLTCQKIWIKIQLTAMVPTPSSYTGNILLSQYLEFFTDGWRPLTLISSNCRLPVPRKGKVLGLVGKNGIGKSTALKILAGQLKPNLGRLKVHVNLLTQ